MRTLLAPKFHPRRLHSVAHPSHQRGAALILSLVFLLLLTILGVTAVSTSTLQEKMAGNLKDQNVAFQATETGLRGGETRLLALSAASVLASGQQPIPDNTGSSGIFATGFVDALNNGWWGIFPTYSANSTEYGVAGGTPETQAAADPRYAIEMAAYQKDSVDAPTAYKPVSGMTYYRIWSRGVGGTTNAQSALQSTFKIPGP